MSSNCRKSSRCPSWPNKPSNSWLYSASQCLDWVTSTFKAWDRRTLSLRTSSTTSTQTTRSTARKRRRWAVAAKISNCNLKTWALYSWMTRSGARRKAKCASPKNYPSKRSTSWALTSPPTSTTASATNATIILIFSRTKSSWISSRAGSIIHLSPTSKNQSPLRKPQLN